jgi:hypothetical protein
MTSRKDAIDTEEMLRRLERVGIARQDAEALRRISMQLHRWHELECGTDYGAIERNEETGKPWFRQDRGGAYLIPDREAGALRRLQAVMARYPSLGFYVQGDPRGAALYVLRPGDVPEGENVDAYYSRGTAVYR